MFCTNCGVKIEETGRFCSQCGTAVPGAVPPASQGAPKRLFRLHDERKIAGVCAGFSRYFDVDVTFCRLAAIGLTLITGVAPGLLTYLCAWIIMPVQFTVAPPAPGVPVSA